jgi:hypothetical protein
MSAGALPFVWTRVIRKASGEVAEPNGCELCGWGRREHSQFYFGLHAGDGRTRGYVMPTDATRKARMLARRASRRAVSVD